MNLFLLHIIFSVLSRNKTYIFRISVYRFISGEGRRLIFGSKRKTKKIMSFYSGGVYFIGLIVAAASCNI